eukprot:3788526-Rhodomonas_salina.1
MSQRVLVWLLSALLSLPHHSSELLALNKQLSPPPSSYLAPTSSFLNTLQLPPLTQTCQHLILRGGINSIFSDDNDNSSLPLDPVFSSSDEDDDNDDEDADETEADGEKAALLSGSCLRCPGSSLRTPCPISSTHMDFANGLLLCGVRY